MVLEQKDGEKIGKIGGAGVGNLVEISELENETLVIPVSSTNFLRNE